ncbi:MAG: type II toxin-antitoxin system RelE/ParE family toxin [Peptostreptococcaceae bacterium]|nr:type II toxin-antitoxin system RelE/ParE family toxin [Peptostreptococcaceae bacterium]
MNRYEVQYSKKAIKFTKKNRLIAIKFRKAFDELSENLSSHNRAQIIHKYDIKKYHDSEYNDIYRLRIGDYRAIFRVINQKLVILVIEIGARGDIYKSE